MHKMEGAHSRTADVCVFREPPSCSLKSSLLKAWKNRRDLAIDDGAEYRTKACLGGYLMASIIVYASKSSPTVMTLTPARFALSRSSPSSVTSVSPLLPATCRYDAS